MTASTNIAMQGLVAAVNEADASSSNTKLSTSSKSAPSISWTRYVLAIIAVPFLIGFAVSMMKYEQVSMIVDPIVEKLKSTVAQTTRRFLTGNLNDTYDTVTTTITKGPPMDVDKCFQKLEQIMFENKKSQHSNWDNFNSVTIVMHRNGQGESCGNSSSSISGGGTGSNKKSLASVFRAVLQDLHALGHSCPDFSNKYHVDAFLTRFFVHAISTGPNNHPLSPSSTPLCHSEEGDKKNDELGLYDFCDMGDDKTPILLDHKKLIPNTVIIQSGTGSSDRNNSDQQKKQYTLLPCHFHTEHGLRVTSLPQLTKLLSTVQYNNNDTVVETASDCTITSNGDNLCNAESDVPTTNSNDNNYDRLDAQTTGRTVKELHLYAVPAGRVFMHVAAYIGQIIALDHVPGADPTRRVFLKVLSVSPAVFDLYNFFTKDESSELVNRALSETKESHRIKRSTTGTGEHHVNTRRTSESGFDTDGATSILIKKRCFQVLGFDEYIESHGDGLQILRYNQTTAYIPHLDYLDIDKRLEHDYDSSKKGGNRFATILLYMTDLDEKDGGETVFIDAWPTGQREEDHKPIETSLRELRESDQHGILEEGSWQEKMVAQCRSRLAIRPDSARAVLFYSQFPNGKQDPNSRHGGCPVLSGVKYAANLWVWNTPRDGYAGNPKNPDFKQDKKSKAKKEEEKEVEGVPKGRVTATFRNNGKDARLVDAKLYFHDGTTDKEWGALGSGENLSIYTYKSHVWKVMVGDETFHTFTIDNDTPSEQEFLV